MYIIIIKYKCIIRNAIWPTGSAIIQPTIREVTDGVKGLRADEFNEWG